MFNVCRYISCQIRSDTSLCLNSTLPHIYAKSQQMKAIFERIDKLEVTSQLGHTEHFLLLLMVFAYLILDFQLLLLHMIDLITVLILMVKAFFLFRHSQNMFVTAI